MSKMALPAGSGGLRIGPVSRPSTFRALTELLSNNGAINRLEPAPLSFTVRDGWTTSQLDAIETALATLSDKERAAFVGGEESEAKEIAARSGALAGASALMDAWFEGEIEEHRP